VARKRAFQISLWFLLGPLFGFLQTGPSYLPSLGHHMDAVDVWTLMMIPVVYGTGWLTSALLLCDIIFLRRALEAATLRWYVGIIALVALFSGLLFQQFLIMIGHPITGAAILFIAYTFRKKPSVSQSRATHPMRPRSGS
jgi:hypothetical protein